MTKIAFGCASLADLRARIERDADERHLVTRTLPRRFEEMAGGSLYWIHDHALVARSPLIGFAQRTEDARWTIRLEPRLIAVEPRHKRAHQGWRYLAAQDAPPDLAECANSGEVLPARLIGELARLGLA